MEPIKPLPVPHPLIEAPAAPVAEVTTAIRQARERRALLSRRKRDKEAVRTAKRMELEKLAQEEAAWRSRHANGK